MAKKAKKKISKVNRDIPVGNNKQVWDRDIGGRLALKTEKKKPMYKIAGQRNCSQTRNEPLSQKEVGKQTHL